MACKDSNKCNGNWTQDRFWYKKSGISRTGIEPKMVIRVYIGFGVLKGEFVET